MTDEWTIANFVDFSRAEINSGGPDPQTTIASSVPDPWFAGCFVCPYTVGAGIAVYTAFPTPEDVTGGRVRQWLHENWAGIAVRRERRAVWAADKLAESLCSYAVWVRTEYPKLVEASYDELWASVNKHVWSFGRYATLKLLGTLELQGAVTASQPDIRPHGAKYPRRALSKIFSDDQIILKGETDPIITRVNALAFEMRAIAAFDYGLPLTWNAFEILLCNYRQSLATRYPGRSNDSELSYYLKAEEHFGHEFMTRRVHFWKLRRDLFPASCLAEVQGWTPGRKELGATWKDHGYFWDDTVYDYNKTVDLAHPVPR